MRSTHPTTAQPTSLDFLLSRLSIVAVLFVFALAGCAGGIAEFSGPDAPSFAPYSAAQRPKIALVLGAGGPRGFAHIGVLKVLEEEGFDADLVVGASVGAMLGSLYANRISATEMERMAIDLDVKRFIGVSTSGFTGNGRAVQHFIEEYTQGKPLDAMARKLAVVAATTSNNQLMVFNRGNTSAAVRASSATPKQFAPVRINGVEYHDGDEAEPVPVKAARDLGADLVVAIDVSAHVSAIPSNAPPAWTTRDRLRASKVAAQAVFADVFIHPDLGYYASISDQYRKMCIARGEAAARAALPQLRAALAQQRLAKG